MNKPDANRELTTILLVEDDDVDAISVSRALKTLENPVRVVRARDGVEALAILRGEGQPAADALAVTRPYLIVLDLVMPRMDGHEFLANLRDDPELRSSVVFVLTTCDEDEDRSRAHSHHIAGFIRKELAAKGSRSVARLLDRFIDQVEFPHR